MKTIFLLIGLFILNALNAQTHLNAKDIKFEKSGENIQVKKLSSTKESSAFAIQVLKSVKAHYHADHTETLIVKSGSAEMMMNDDLYLIGQGDFIEIPPRTVHAVEVTSKVPLVVISIQAPEFLGSDRHFVEE